MLCSIHQKEFHLVPAGISKKTGKPYPAFYTCPTFGCTEKPPKDEWESDKQDFIDTVEATKAPTKPATGTDGDSAIWEAKDRMNMAQSALKAAAEIVAAEIAISARVPNYATELVDKRLDDLKAKNYKWLMEKKNG